MRPHHRDIIRLCAQTNWAYMATQPAGQIEEFQRVRRIYDRLATQGYECAQAWLEGRAPPPHEPGVDAFWWAVAAWSNAFMHDVLSVSPIYLAQGKEVQERISRQVSENFYLPHLEFAKYLRPRPSGVIAYDPMDLRNTYAHGQIILAHDAKWTRLGVRLAVRWHPLYLVKEFRTIREAVRLSGALRNSLPSEKWAPLPPGPGEPSYNPIARAYLESDLVFLRELFGHFEGLRPDQWSGMLKRIIAQFLDSVEAELA